MSLEQLFNIEGKNIIITGGTRGLGKAIVDNLSTEKSFLTVIAQNKTNLEKLKNEHPDINIYQCDLKDDKAIKDFCIQYIHDYKYCDILINNAGISLDGSIDVLDYDNFIDVYKVNLFAPFLLIKYILPSMKERRKGIILNVSSTLATRAAPSTSVYCSSKAALVQFTRCLSIETAPYNIRSNCISPGYCKTDLNSNFFNSPNGQAWIKNKIPQQRLMEKEELIPLVRLLISDAGSYINGANMIIDGGLGNW